MCMKKAVANFKKPFLLNLRVCSLLYNLQLAGWAKNTFTYYGVYVLNPCSFLLKGEAK